MADDSLIDHILIRYKTLLSEKGIHFERGETVDVINMQTGQVETANLDDELNFEIDTFNNA